MEEPVVSEQRETSGRLSPTAIAVVAVTVIVVVLLGYGLIASPNEPLVVGNPVPDFQLTAFDGSEMSLSAAQGQVVVVNFFASWCTPCRKEAPALEETWREYQDQGVQFYGIAYKDAQSKAQAFLDEFDATYPSAVDPGNGVARSYGVTGVPETFIVDQDGNLARHYLGAVTRLELSLEIDRQLGP